jgi:hypothetical protein
MAGAREAREEAMRVPEHPHPPVGGQRGPLRIGDPRIHGEAGGLACARQFHRLFRLDTPGMIDVEVRELARHVFGLGQAGAGVAGRVAGDRAGLGHGLLHGLGTQVCGAGRTLALAEIDRDGHAAVTVVFDGLDFAHAHRHRQAFLHAGVGIGGARPGRTGQFQRLADHLLQFGNSRRVYFLGHGRIVPVRGAAPRRNTP